MGAGQVQGMVESGVGDVITVAVGLAGDQAVRAELQVVGHVSGVFCPGVADQAAEVTVDEPVGQEPEDQRAQSRA